MATYPTAVYTYTNRTGTQTLAAGTHSTIHNEAAAEVIAIETELGVSPKGIYVDVGSRLDALTAAIGAQHTQNTDAGTSGTTFYMDGSSGPKIKVSGTTFSVRDTLDTVYVDFICDDLTCATINGITSAALTSAVGDAHTHVNYALIQTYTQTEANLLDAVTKKHTQNTDTGSTNETFQLNNVNPLNSAKLKVDDLTPTIMDVRNAADSAFAPLRALEFRGDLTVNNADINLARIRFNDTTDRWQFSNDGTTFIDFFPAAGSLSILDTASIDLAFTGLGELTAAVIPGGVDHNQLLNYSILQHYPVGGAVNEVQYNNGTGGLAAEAGFYYNPATDTLFVPNINVSGFLIGAVAAGGTTSDTWEINTDGNGIIIDTAGLTGDITVLASDLVPVTVLDSASVDFTLVGQQITAVVLPAGVDHNSLNNYSANRHIDHTAVTVSAGTGLTGGGDISASRTLSLSHLGIQSLTDPNADRIMFWDDTSGFVDWLTVSTGLNITGTTLTNSDTGSAAVTAHNIAYDHTLLHAAVTVLDTASIDFGLSGQQITGSVLPAGVDHDSLNNFSANEHVDHTGVSISAGTGLTGGGDISANRTISLSHLGIQNLTDPNADRLLIWDDVDGYVTWLTLGTNLTYTHATHTLSASGGATLTRATFTNATLSSGVLTITHSAGLSAPYTVMVMIFDNNNQQIIPDSVTGATNSVAVDLSSYVTAGGGSISGTWGYGYIA